MNSHEAPDSPLVDMFNFHAELAEDSAGVHAQGLIGFLERAKGASLEIALSNRADEERQLARSLYECMPTAVLVVREVWEEMHQRTLSCSDQSRKVAMHELPRSDLFRSMRALCLLAHKTGRTDAADRLGQVVEQSLDNPGGFRLNQRIAAALGGDVDSLLCQVEEKPDDEPLRLAVAASLLLVGHEGWKAEVDHLIASSSDPQIRQASIGLQSLSKH